MPLLWGVSAAEAHIYQAGRVEEEDVAGSGEAEVTEDYLPLAEE